MKKCRSAIGGSSRRGNEADCRRRFRARKAVSTLRFATAVHGSQEFVEPLEKLGQNSEKQRLQSGGGGTTLCALFGKNPENVAHCHELKS